MHRRIVSRFVIKTVIFTVLYWPLVAVMDLYFDGFLVDLSDALLGIGWILLENKVIISVGIYLAVIYIIAYRAIRRAQKNFDEIYIQTQKVLKQEAEIDTLPNELKDIEVCLKDIKYTVFYNDRIAREAEQRKNDLVVYLAHDLKTPLTSVIGYMSLLEECPELPVKMRAKYTSIALDKAYRLEQLINEFFDITRFSLQSIQLENNRIDMTMMISQMLEEFYPILAEKKIRLKTDIEPGMRMIGDADKLARVFDNLLRNAVNYSYPETVISIEARQTEDNIKLVFRNTGDEIPQEKLEYIFEKFFRVDAARSSATGGSGLGLAIAKQIVEAHGGSISASSNSEYTEFRVVLPKKVIKA